MLERMSSRELSEWQAYEKATGPLRGYDEDMLAAIHEQLQILNHVTGAANAGDDNPIPAPTKVLRPHQVFLPEKGEETMTQSEFDTQF